SGNYGSNTEDYYYFTYGNAIFISISTQTFRDGTIPFERQARWLDEVLTHNPRKWKFVYFHHPIYTKNVVFDISHPPNEVNQNAALVPVFDKHHIDIVFTSHNHWYERYEPSACANAGKPSSDNPCSVGANNFDKGTVYVVSGGAGAFTIPAVLCGMQAGRVKCSGDHHYIIITIKNETLTFEAYSAYPQQNKLMDSFTITKAKNNCVLSPDAGYEVVSEDIRTDAETIDIGTIDILDTSYTDSNLSDIIFQKDEVFYEDIPDFALYDNIAEDLEEVDTKTFDTIEKTDIITQDIIGGDILIKGDEAMGGAEESKGCGCNVLE
ncbi:MAG: hypothetical protein ACPL7I_11040, partial [Myxococcota bacterium]